MVRIHDSYDPDEFRALVEQKLGLGQRPNPTPPATDPPTATEEADPRPDTPPEIAAPDQPSSSSTTMQA